MSARGEDERWASLASGAGMGRARLSARARRLGLASILVVVTLFGTRNLLFGHLPLVGQLTSFPSPTTLLSHFFGGWENAGWQRPGPAPSAFGIVGLAGAVLLGATTQVDKLLFLLPIAVGAVGMFRLLRPFGSEGAQFTATGAYLGLPLVWNDMATGDLHALAAFAAMPYVLGRLARASRLAPFDPPGGTPVRSSRRQVVAEVAPLGLLLALLGAVSPPAILAVGVLAVGLLVGGAAGGGAAGLVRAAGVALGGVVVAVGCLFPWSLTFFQPGARWSIFSGASPSLAGPSGITTLLRFGVGPLGAGWLTWGLVVAGGFSLVVARGPRLSWAARCWLAALASFVTAYAGTAGWLGSGGGATRALLAPAACCLAVAAGLGVAAFQVDLSMSRFGWRQSLIALGVISLALGLGPTLAFTTGGRSSLPTIGYDQVLSWTSVGASTASSPYRVLWIGSPAAIPGPSWQIRDGLGFAVSVDGLPDGTRSWPSPNPSIGATVASDVVSAESGRGVRLGAALAQAGIRYVIVPSAVAPVLPGSQSPQAAPAPASLTEAFAAQSDLRQLPTEGGVVAFADTAWPATGSRSTGGVPLLAVAPKGGSALLRELGLAAGLLVVVLALAEGVFRRRREHRLRPIQVDKPRELPVPAGTAARLRPSSSHTVPAGIAAGSPFWGGEGGEDDEGDR